MPKVDVYNMQGKKVSDVELSEAVFGIEPNENVVHSALVNYLANQRQGTQSTKTRAEVRGGGRKPWRQKGTGRARQGSIRAPQWIKGGIALGPKPRSYSYRINKKEKQLAIKSILSAKVLDNELTVVDKLELKETKTKIMAKALADLKVEGKALIILADKNENISRSSRNIEGVKTIELNTINVFDLLNCNKLVLPLDTVKKLEEESNDEMQSGKYTFEVNKKATKVQIANAVEKLFEVKVLNVNTMIVKGKTKRVRYVEGKTSDWKKAIVTIDTNPGEKTYLGKGGKVVKVSKKYKDSIDEFMGA